MNAKRFLAASVLTLTFCTAAQADSVLPSAASQHSPVADVPVADSIGPINVFGRSPTGRILHVKNSDGSEWTLMPQGIGFPNTGLGPSISKPATPKARPDSLKR